jgi:hypothetical protein
VVEDDRAFDIEGPIVGNARMRRPKRHLECRLSLLERQRAQVHVIELEKVEGAERGEVVVLIVASEGRQRAAR